MKANLSTWSEEDLEKAWLSLWEAAVTCRQLGEYQLRAWLNTHTVAINEELRARLSARQDQTARQLSLIHPGAYGEQIVDHNQSA